MFISNPPMPYCGHIGTQLCSGSLIKINGQSFPSSSCFAINLQCGSSVNPRDDVALHLSPVFTSPPRIVRNSISSNRWGPEESFGGFPLTPGSSFEFMILVEYNEFKIALNGQHFTEFHHRLPIERISHIAIDGDVQIHSISVEGSPYSSASAPPLDAPTAPYVPGGAAPPYPTVNPPYPAGASVPYPPASGNLYPSLNSQSDIGFKPYEPQSMGAAPYPPQGAAYPSASAYPNQSSGAYVPGSYPYPGQNAPPTGPGYPQSSSHNKPGIGGMLGSALAGVTGGIAASSIGSKLFGGGHKHHHQSHHHQQQYPSHHKSKPIPIGTIAAGAGAAALGAAVLTGHHPFKKAKKLFKHKHKFGKFHHKGWGSSSSSSSEEE